MYLSDVLTRLQDIKADLRQAYRLGKWREIETVMDSMTHLTKDIEFALREAKYGEANDRVGQTKADGERSL